MRRVNQFAVEPRSDQDEALLRELLDASASLWNELNYERRQNLFEGKSVWDTTDYRKQYVGVLGSATAQQVIRKNDKAWKSFFSTTENGEKTGPPGYWGNEEEGRILQSYFRNDMYRIRWSTGARRPSVLEIPVGKDLKEKYGIGGNKRLRLEVRGDPRWLGEKCQLQLHHDECADQFRAIQPVKDCSRQDSPLAEESAALDVGANTLVACTTTTGQQYLYEGRDLFERFRATTEEIARLQSKLREGRYSSNRIRRLYRQRSRRRDHAQNALIRDLIEQLHAEGVSTIYVGDLTDVLSTSWSVVANQKTHNFWTHRRFIDRIRCTAEEYGITVEEEPEAWTSTECPDCGSLEETTRHGDSFTCTCGFEGHADLVASETFLERQTGDRHRPMTRPVRFEWDDHDWSESPHSHRPKEPRTNRQATSTG